VTVNPLPIVTASTSVDTVCAGSNVTLTGGGAISYTWDNGVTDGVSFAASTTTLYTVTGTDANSCSNTAGVTVYVNALPTVVFTPFSSMICDNAAPFTLTNGSPAGGIYSGSGVTAGSFDPALSGDGTFLLTYTVTDTNSCVNSDTASVNVSVCTGVLANNAGQFIMYPNPTSGSFNLSITNANFSQLIITIVDVQGKVVYSAAENNAGTEFNKVINLENLAKGVYYVKLNTGADIKIEKLIVH
jgi:hypothetical protein